MVILGGPGKRRNDRHRRYTGPGSEAARMMLRSRFDANSASICRRDRCPEPAARQLPEKVWSPSAGISIASVANQRNQPRSDLTHNPEISRRQANLELALSDRPAKKGT